MILPLGMDRLNCVCVCVCFVFQIGSSVLLALASKHTSWVLYLIGCSTIGRSCGKTASTSFTGSTKHELSLHGNVKPLQLAANGSSRLAYRSLVLKNQWNLSASSSSANAVTTFDDDEVVPSSVSDEKIGVLLLNLGGPETLDDVQPFLFNLFADPVSCYTPLYHHHYNFPVSGPVH